MLESLIDLGWKSALIAGAALLATRAMRGRAAAERVLLLRVALAALLLLPALALLLPAIEFALLPAPKPVPMPADLAPIEAIALSEPAALPAAAAPDPLWLLYLGGAALVLLHFAAGIVTLWRWTRAARPAADARWAEALARGAAGVRRPVRLLVSPKVDSPISWGVAPAWVLIDPALERNPSEADAVVAHELAHVRRFDWPVLVASRLAIALYWFNPLVWLVDRALVREAEFAADDAAIRHIARADYAQTLLAVATPGGRQPACAMAMGNSALARRIRRLLEERAPHPASRLLCAVLMLGIPVAAVPLAAARIVPGDPAAIVERKVLSPTATTRVLRSAAPTQAGAAGAVVAPETGARVRPDRIARDLARAERDAARRERTSSALPTLAELTRPPAPPRPPVSAAVERLLAAEAERVAVPPSFWDRFARTLRPDRPNRPDPVQEAEDEGSSEPQGSSRLERMRRWISRLRSEANRLENAARYYPESVDVRNAYIKAASDARRQAQMLERDMQKLNPGQ